MDYWVSWIQILMDYWVSWITKSYGLLSLMDYQYLTIINNNVNPFMLMLIHRAIIQNDSF